MPEIHTAGRMFAEAGSPDALLALERGLGLQDHFVVFEGLVARLLERSGAGDRIVEYQFGDRSDFGSVRLVGCGPDDVAAVQEHYQLEVQQRRGAWFLPEETTVTAGLTIVPSLAVKTPRFFWNAVRDSSVKLDLRRPGDALLVWAVLAPLFELMYRPFALRADTGKPKDADAQEAAWDQAELSYHALGLPVDNAFAALRFGGSWSRLSLDQQLQCRRQLLEQIAAQPAAEVARRWRASATQQLIAAFYKKAKATTPLAAKVLAKPMQPLLAGVFGGDWLAFLRYLGETPNPSERITTTLPETRLYVPDAGKTEAVAAHSGLLVDDVERILAAYLGQDRIVSPVTDRLDALKRWWPIFDDVHARQAKGMESLWGFVDDGIFQPVPGMLYEVRAKPGQFRRLLPADLAVEIEQLWDGITLPKYPERIVSEFHPHHQMAETLGPAVDFWHGITLTCWFVCEGPTRRTDLAGAEHFYRGQLRELDRAGFPIDRTLFAELIDAETRLGTPQDAGGHETHYEVPGRGTFTIIAGVWQRRDGFEYLRDIITRHRRTWAQRFDEYLQHRWQSELRQVGREFNRRIAARDKPPTLKQFASVAAPAANHWFGGDFRALYAALGEPSPARPERVDLLVGDPIEFVEALFLRLGGQHLDPARLIENAELRLNQWAFSRLAQNALRYLQIWEATGYAPSFDAFKRETIDWNVLGGEERGWATYTAAIEEMRVRPTAGPAHARTPPQQTSR